MYDITVTCLKEQGVAKKVVKEFKGAKDFGWFDHCPVLFIVLEDGYHYFTQYEVQQVAVVEVKEPKPVGGEVVNIKKLGEQNEI